MDRSTAKALSLTGIAVFLVGLTVSCGGTPPNFEPTPDSTPMVLGQQPPGETPESFAPGIVNTDAIELNGVVSPDGREFFFTRVINDVFVMHRCLLREDGSWSDPEPVYTYPDRAPGLAVDMAYSPDGSRLYFLGRYSEDLGADETNSDLFVMERQGDGGWSLASALPAPVNTPDHRESYPSVVADGSLYFTSDRPGGQGKADIWRAQRLADGSFDEPVNLGPPVNSEHRAGRHRRRRPLRVLPARRRGLERTAAAPADDQQRSARLLPDGHARRPLPVLLAPHRRQLGRGGRGQRLLGRRRGDRADASVNRRGPLA
jgi:hypothetical protein